jgi:hypothetical protein
MCDKALEPGKLVVEARPGAGSPFGR